MLLKYTHVCNAYLHHLGRVIHRPYHKLLPGLLALASESDMSFVRGLPAPGYYCSSDLSPSVVAKPGNHIENASQSSQKYFRAMFGATPMCDRLKYGTYALAAFTKRGCQSPRMMRGISLASHSGYEVIILSISEKTCSGSLFTFTSMLNLTC